MSTQTVHEQAEIPAGLAGWRLDRALAELFPDYSRSRLQKWLKSGAITVDGRVPRPRDSVAGGERVVVDAALEAADAVTGQALPLDVRYQDDSLIVIAKPAGLVVHPGAGNHDGTLQNALLHHFPELAALPRSGIVHRLDRDTSGVMVVARSLAAHRSLVEQLQERRMGREYLAVVAGVFTAGGHVDAPIGRHPRERTRMAVREGGRAAVTHYRIAERFPAHTLLRCRLESGRTHQIRVHMAHIRHPIVGDPVYGGRMRLPPGADEAVTAALRGFRRQALHAERLTLSHPETGDAMEWTVAPPEDFLALCEALRAHRDRGPDG
ncbi:23S rRNA pseudouridine(1911/1915/1917) synthase RluD [Arhodomonas aquaeolei]|uniref:23S rRNA pseudouridine(1911/1915/1917) synthase RluD n=1 Tax=Arhodomonas aquaeolei TaxID=2369 RepID=UPI00038023CF|nr:23S rRNA pseudouridine(1911/1915/1917) synthase RluD [Arhodomonas aquaeolei]MCS4504119.1 23S rRNA pseudouridine(1911/1915/1917) synthase RluD [Arhodomonas aquaeolei]